VGHFLLTWPTFSSFRLAIAGLFPPVPVSFRVFFLVLCWIGFLLAVFAGLVSPRRLFLFFAAGLLLVCLPGSLGLLMFSLRVFGLERTPVFPPLCVTPFPRSGVPCPTGSSLGVPPFPLWNLFTFAGKQLMVLSDPLSSPVTSLPSPTLLDASISPPRAISVTPLLGFAIARVRRDRSPGQGLNPLFFCVDVYPTSKPSVKRVSRALIFPSVRRPGLH